MASQEEFARRRLLQQQLMAKALTGGTGGYDFKAGDPPAKAWQPVIQQFGALMAGKRLAKEEGAANKKFQDALAGALTAGKGTPGTPAVPFVDEQAEAMGLPQTPGLVSEEAVPGKKGGRDAVLESLAGSGIPELQMFALKGMTEKPAKTWETINGPRGSMLQRDPATGEMKQVVAPESASLAQLLFGQQAAGRESAEDPNAPWKHITDPKKRDEAKIRFGAAADARLSKEQEDVSKSQNMINSLDRFLYLNEKNPTGGLFKVPGSQMIGTAMSEDLAEMKSLQDLMTPQMRQGMPGAASDRDVAMFRGATVGLEKQPEANRNIATGLKIANQNTIDRANFIAEYVSRKGHDRGADAEWKRYLSANPIFDPKSKPGSYTLNPNRVGYQDWASGGGKPISGPGNAAPQKGGLSPEEQAELEQLRKELNRGR